MDTGDEDCAAQADVSPGLTAALDDLKRRGSALLVVGAVPADVYREVSAQMLGDGGSAPRRRLLVTGASDGERDSRLKVVRRRTPEWTRLLEFDGLARGAATATPSRTTATPSSPDTSMEATFNPDSLRRRVEGDVAQLGIEIAKTVDQFERISGGLAPAELRVAFDCLPTLVAEYGEETAFRFSHVLANHIRGVDGMVHCWLPRDRDDQLVRTLEPLFDATVELRLEETHLQQRWHFRDVDLSSDWLCLG
ncbi:DUF7504 family protein [Halogeometricum limi]|uniref:Uncharacterized protein n=1 Tax=Halogeometricum limi TaxID=555875 RepID=A0A1I6GMP8_9EURY|nr:hypothetical protein [Halogeometricum limi]SFR43438.1 hypothetical protein SAMN04488124_1277 [Halogeometricum limi]